MNNYAIIENGLVVNIVVLDTDSSWNPPEGCITVMAEEAVIGCSYIDGKFIHPVVEAKAITKDEVESLRLTAYANPVLGSDRYFSESIALQAEGFAASSTEVKEAKAKGLARKAEIQALYPYPVE